MLLVNRNIRGTSFITVHKHITPKIREKVAVLFTDNCGY